MLTDERSFDRSDRRDDPALWSAESPGGIIATAHYLATRAGAEILEEGGNAIDAAVAASLALGVCEPAGSGLGGMAMLLVHDGRTARTTVYDGACPAPVRATPQAVAASPRYSGYRAVAVPTYVAVVARVIERHCTLPAARLLKAAIDLAEQGVRVSHQHAQLTQRYLKALRKHNAGAVFLQANGDPLAAGTVHRQPVLARTLRRLAEAGLDDFYTGEVGRKIIADMQANNGFLCADDFAKVPWPKEREPLEGTFEGRTVHTVPEPGGGHTLLQLLAIHEALPDSLRDPDTPAGAVALTSAIQRVRRDRATAHSKEGVKRPQSDRLAPDYVGALATGIASDIADAGHGEGETTHLSVLDRHGNAVSLTQSIERCFGAKVLTPELGFLFNNYMKGFKIQATHHPHYLRPGAFARSNAAPTIVFDSNDRKPCIAIGSTGSERMLSGIFQVLVRLRQQAPFDAVHAPRMHCTPDGEVLLEDLRMQPDVLHALTEQGFRLSSLGDYSFQVGGLHLAVRTNGRSDRVNRFIGVAEPRRDGAAAGPDA